MAELGLEVRPPDPWFKRSQSEALYDAQGSAGVEWYPDCWEEDGGAQDKG